MPYKIDSDVLHKVAKQVVGLPLEGGELITRATELLSDRQARLQRASRRKLTPTRREMGNFASARR
jgi:hypothetical protein